MKSKEIILTLILILVLSLNTYLFLNLFKKNEFIQILTLPLEKKQAKFIMDDEIILTCESNFNEGCRINAPIIEKQGSRIIGWSKDKYASKAEYIPLDDILLMEKETTFYAIIEKRLNVQESFRVGNYIVEIEEGTRNSDKIIEYLKLINEKWPFLFKIGGKITIMRKKTYRFLWPNAKDTVGLAQPKTKTIDFDGDDNSTNLAVLVHELAHNFDINCQKYDKTETFLNVVQIYSLMFNKYYYNEISKTKEFNDLFNKYKNESNKPLRDYSYTDIKEFFADALGNYFEIKYNGYSILKTNDEIENLVSNFLANIDNICN